MTAAEGAESREARLQSLREQREHALACAWLSLAISLALILSHFPENTKPVDAAREAVAVHKKLLLEAEDVFLINEQELKNTRQALETMRAAQKPKTQ